MGSVTPASGHDVFSASTGAELSTELPSRHEIGGVHRSPH
jgi:hypothetical protein